jgi:hypothetical protein
MSVEEGITTNGDPLINVTLAPGILSGVGEGPGVKVIAEDIIKTGVPSSVAVCP